MGPLPTVMNEQAPPERFDVEPPPEPRLFGAPGPSPLEAGARGVMPEPSLDAPPTPTFSREEEDPRFQSVLDGRGYLPKPTAAPGYDIRTDPVEQRRIQREHEEANAPVEPFDPNSPDMMEFRAKQDYTASLRGGDEEDSFEQFSPQHVRASGAFDSDSYPGPKDFMSGDPTELWTPDEQLRLGQEAITNPDFRMPSLEEARGWKKGQEIFDETGIPAPEGHYSWEFPAEPGPRAAAADGPPAGPETGAIRTPEEAPPTEGDAWMNDPQAMEAIATIEASDMTPAQKAENIAEVKRLAASGG